MLHQTSWQICAPDGAAWKIILEKKQPMLQPDLSWPRIQTFHGAHMTPQGLVQIHENCLYGT